MLLSFTGCAGIPGLSELPFFHSHSWVEATCLTQGCTEHTCGTCGVWYTVTAAPTGHTETTQSTELGLEHRCAACESHWYTEE